MPRKSPAKKAPNSPEIEDDPLAAFTEDVDRGTFGAADPFQPLAERLRPRTLADVVGQRALIGPGKPFSRMVERGKLHSMILWGPPGTGKTTIASILARSTSAKFFALSAISSSVKDLREAIAAAQIANRTAKERSVLFIDEIHRFTKSQQDALLGAVEAGTVTLIGATTENPSFEVIQPLLSRARVFVLEPLTREDLEVVLDRALHQDEELKQHRIEIEPEAHSALLALCGGDARKLLSALDLAVQLGTEDGSVHLTQETIEQAYGRKASRYDKGGEEHYNIISAFIKSMRGSDPNAAVYWLARMIEGGEDLEFIARRMIIFASEDVGNADPNALLLATSCWDAVRAVGYPEASIILSHVVTYLASAAKSNASYMAINHALSDAAEEPNTPVPLHLRNAPTGLMKSLGYSKGYKYAHSYEGHFTRDLTYLPEGMESKLYYDPTMIGREKAIRERLNMMWPEKYPITPTTATKNSEKE